MSSLRSPSRRALVLGSASAASAAIWRPVRAQPRIAPLLEGMGSYRADDATRSPLARRYVAQGLVLAWGFNAAESVRSFTGALAQDPACAAGWWGRAWAAGPTINADMDPADAAAVAEAIERASALARRAPPRWRGLIEALAARHPRSSAAVDETAYERRMQALLERHPRDADIAMLAAEALMNLHPYDWWHADGRAQPWTPEIERRLQLALRLAPDHPGAHHLWIHLMERSPAPERARTSADRLRTLVPGSGHLLHMPSHIDMRLGDYAAAVRANEVAIEADRRYLAQVDAQGAYRIGYVAHNHHFLWAAASMQGAAAKAIAAADEAAPSACGPLRPEPGRRDAGTVQHLQALPLYARVRFGRWQEILTGMRPPDGNDPYPLLVWHYARGTAQSRLGRPAEARAELERLERLLAEPALGATKVKNIHPATTLARIALLTLRADLELAQARAAQALPALREAVALEDALEPDEPHAWLAPTRHALGAGALAAGRWDEALQVFEQDLRHYPGNGWALAGLWRAQQRLGHEAVARATEARLRDAWRNADRALDVPRL